jgi:hypothetical protein
MEPRHFSWDVDPARTMAYCTIDANAFIIICIANNRDGTGKK